MATATWVMHWVGLPSIGHLPNLPLRQAKVVGQNYDLFPQYAVDPLQTETPAHHFDFYIPPPGWFDPPATNARPHPQGGYIALVTGCDQQIIDSDQSLITPWP